MDYRDHTVNFTLGAYMCIYTKYIFIYLYTYFIYLYKLRAPTAIHWPGSQRMGNIFSSNEITGLLQHPLVLLVTPTSA